MLTIGLWYKLFSQAGLVCVLLHIKDCIIAYKGLGNSIRGKSLWQIVCLTLLWIVWQERNSRIFQEKERPKKILWDSISHLSLLVNLFYYCLQRSSTHCHTARLACGLCLNQLIFSGFALFHELQRRSSLVLIRFCFCGKEFSSEKHDMMQPQMHP